MQRSLIIMVKEPRPGRVKTRLAAGVGTVAAACWYRQQALRVIRRLCIDPRWRTYLAVAPDREGGLSRVWPAHIPRIPQGQGDLGARMARMLDAPPPGPVLLIGSDIPGVMPDHIARGFAALGAHDAVFGPAPDGGFWMVGAARRRALPLGLFQNCRWSGPDALSDAKRSFDGHRLGVTDALDDVDTLDDLKVAAAKGCTG